MKKYINLKIVLAGLFVIALLPRIIAVIDYSNKHKTLVVCDQKDYDMIAVNLAAGKGYIDLERGLPSSLRAPIYPVFLVTIYRIFGHNYFVVRIIQAVISALVCILIFYIGNIMFGKKIGLLAGFLLAFYVPNIWGWHISGPNFLMTENLAVFLLALLIFFVMKHLFVVFNFKNGILTGILMGLVILTKPFFSLFPLFFFIVLLYKSNYSFIGATKKMLLVAAGLLIIILPWTVRNYFAHRAFVPITTQGGEGLMQGNNPYVYGGGLCNYEILFSREEWARVKEMSEIERDRFYRGYAKKYLAKNYRKVPRLVFKKILALWDVYNYDYSAGNIRIYDSWYVVILIFGLFGIGKSLRNKLDANVLVPIALFMSITFSSMIFAGDPRLRYCVEPYLIIFASSGIFVVYGAFKNKILSLAAIGTIVSINFLIYLNSDLVLSWVRYFMRGCGL